MHPTPECDLRQTACCLQQHIQTISQGSPAVLRSVFFYVIKWSNTWRECQLETRNGSGDSCGVSSQPWEAPEWLLQTPTWMKPLPRPSSVCVCVCVCVCVWWSAAGSWLCLTKFRMETAVERGGGGGGGGGGEREYAPSWRNPPDRK